MNIDFSNLPDKTEPQTAIDFSGLPDNDDNGVWGGLIKPTIKAVPRVIGHTVASMAQAPISGIAAGAKLITSKGDLNAANKVLEENQKALDDFYLTTDAERQGSQNIGLAMKPFQMAGEGWREIGKVTGIPYAEPILGTIGEASAVLGLGGAAKSVKGRVGKAFEGVRDIAKESKGDFSIKSDIDFSKLPDQEIPKTKPQVYVRKGDIETFSDWGETKYQHKTSRELMKGEPVTAEQLPNELYHVTTNADSVYKSGLLKNIKEGEAGLGKGTSMAHQGVSLTLDKNTAELIQRDLINIGEVARSKDVVATIKKIGQEDARISGKPTNDAVNEAIRNYNINKDAKGAYDTYLWGRETATGMENPIFFGSLDNYKKITPSNTKIITVSPRDIPSDAYIRKNPINKHLNEVMVHSDIPVGTLEAMVKGGKTGEPPKYAGDSNLNLERLDTTNDVKHFADGLAKQAGIEKTKQSWAETEKLAQELGWDEKEFLRVAKKKGGFDTAETYAMRQINANAIHNVFKTIREMPADPLQRTDAMRLQAVDAVNNYIEIAKAYTEKTSEAGRSLNIYKKLIAENPDFIQNKSREAAFKKMFDSNGGKKLTDAMIDDLQKTDFNNPLEVRKILQKYHKATLKDKLFEAWLNGILSNPTTHMANIIGNALTMVTKVPETAIAGITRGKIPFGEVKAESVGMVQGIKEGATAAVKAFQSGMPIDMVSKIEHNRYTAISGTKGKIIRIPTRALTAADEFFKAVVYRSEVNRLAYLRAIKDGAKGKNLSTKMAEIINDPTKNTDIFAAARNEALYRTFQQPLGHFANKVMSVRDSWYPAKFIIPFIKTPVNIAKFTLERTPLNYAKVIHDFRNGKITTEQLSYELAKPTLGSLISAATVMYVLDGTITGGAPKNKKERELLYATGWQPYSIKIGNKYYSYSRLEPIGSIFGLTADFVNTVKNSSEKTINETSAEVLMSVTKNLSSKTFLSGISKVLDAISDPEHYGATYIEQLAGSLVPSGVAAVARSTDPYVREVESPIESMQARIPILSQRLPYREGAYQVPIENTGGIMNMISPVKISQENDFKDMAERDIELLRAKRIIEKEKRAVKKEISREKRTN